MLNTAFNFFAEIPGKSWIIVFGKNKKQRLHTDGYLGTIIPMQNDYNHLGIIKKL